MFKINLTPQFSDATLTLCAIGDVLIVNGDALDFSDLPEGGSYPLEAFDNIMIGGAAYRLNGEIHVTVRLPYSMSKPPKSVAFPDPVKVTKNGRVPLPTDKES